MNEGKRIALPHFRSNREDSRKADGMVYRILRPAPPAAKLHHGKAETACIDLPDKAAAPGFDGNLHRRLRQIMLRPLDKIGWPAKLRHHAAEAFRGHSAVERLQGLFPSGIRIGGETCGNQ